MPRSNLMLVASDYLDSKIFAGLAGILGDEATCGTFLGEGAIPSPFPAETIRLAVAASNLVVVSASDQTDMEAHACDEAVKRNVPPLSNQELGTDLSI